MLFTKALIVSLPKEGDNFYKVRIPLFEDTSGKEIIFNALCCHAPGIYGGLNSGDCVYVIFEDNKLTTPVIIGRLYVEEQDDYSKGYFNNLNVSNRASLPASTTFGNMKISALYDTIQYISSQIGLCPYSNGDIYSSSVNVNPNIKWAGTTWTNFGTTLTSTGQTMYNWRRDS